MEVSLRGARSDLEQYLLDKRRRFLKFLPIMVAGAFSYPLYRFALFSEKPNRKTSIALKDIGEGITKITKQEYFIYKRANKITVFDAHCTHMGCIIHFDSQHKVFNCPCHKSRFSIEGVRLRGPAKRNLDTISYKIQNKTLYIG
ncbi:QcrA and Rieske domain-containing protein [Sulfurospirillum sp. 1612]|uniref:QcrA and Rieske domain-containing protein n=1 Tax=Sulfurospirillum sp. 1612 TaxID=3094835 RepID=UPI002F959566